MRQAGPDPGHHPGAEGDIDDQQNRTPIHHRGQTAVPRQPAADQGARGLPGDKGRQNLQGDAFDGRQRHARAAHGQQQHHQQGRDDHSGQIGHRGGAQGGRHIAPRDGGEGDGGLDRRRQQAQIEEADPQILSQPRPRRPEHGQAHQREQQEGGGQHHPLQPPMRQSRPDGAGRQTRAIEEEQQADGRRRRPFGDVRARAASRSQGGQNHRADQHQQVRVDPSAQRVHGPVLGRASGERQAPHQIVIGGEPILIVQFARSDRATK